MVLLDGLEYITTNNEMDKVLLLLYGLRDSTTLSGSKLLIPLDPTIFDVRTIALLEKDFEMVKNGDIAPNDAQADISSRATLAF